MVVQHNLQAFNADRQLGFTTTSLAKSNEKLSSGYRINCAGDDAAGLSISEKMRSQIRGLEKASANAQDGISLIQTAEGALNEVHSILQRMNELATEAANDTNTSIDRTAIQGEIDQLLSEIDRIQSTTQFNTMNLIDGSFQEKNLQVGALSGQRIALSVGDMSASALHLRGGTKTTTVTTYSSVNAASVKTGGNGAKAATNDSNITLTITDASKITRDATFYWEYRQVDSGVSGDGGDPNNTDIQTFVFGESDGAHNIFHLTNLNGGSGKIWYMASGGELVSAANNNGTAVTASREGWYGVTGSVGSYQANYIDSSYVFVQGGTLTGGTTTANSPYVSVHVYATYTTGWAESSDDPLYVAGSVSSRRNYNDSVVASFEENFGVQFTAPTSYYGSSNSSRWLTLNTPTTAESNESGKVALASKSTATVAADGISVMSFDLAGDAMERIQASIDTVSKERAKLGAVQNRLEHTIANLDNIAENTQSAESRIRDTDIADEMVRYSKNSILAQAGQTVLAQANQSTQGVLSLLS